MTQVLWQKSKRKVMNVNQDLHQGEMLLLNVNVYKKFSWIK